MKGSIEKLLSELHKERLKPLGFTKIGKTISRDRGEYVERFNFQGSSRNSADSGWRFYINIGAEFKDLEPEPYWSYFAHTHWAGRLETLLHDLPPHWDHNESRNSQEMKDRLFDSIQRGSAALADRINDFRSKYIEKKQSRAKMQ